MDMSGQRVKMERLFEPGSIGKMRLKNRLVMAPMGTFSADEAGYPTQRTLDYYATRAKGGVGMIIVQATRVSRESLGALQSLPG